MGYDWTQDADCQGAWLFNEGSGTTVADDSQNSNTGNFKGAGEPNWTTKITGSHVDYSVDYDAVDDVVNCGTSDTVFLTGNAQTTVAWVNPTTIGEGVGGYIFYKRIPITGPAMGFRLTATNTLRFFNDGSTQLSVTGSNSQYTLENPIFVSVTWDGSVTAANVHLYVNGAEISGYATQQNGATLGSNTGGDNLLGNGTAGGNTIDGLLAEVGTFDAVLDLTDINDIMDNGLKQAESSSTGFMTTNRGFWGA